MKSVARPVSTMESAGLLAPRADRGPRGRHARPGVLGTWDWSDFCSFLIPIRNETRGIAKSVSSRDEGPFDDSRRRRDDRRVITALFPVFLPGFQSHCAIRAAKNSGSPESHGSTLLAFFPESESELTRLIFNFQ